jgi:hypothetical protein
MFLFQQSEVMLTPLLPEHRFGRKRTEDGTPIQNAALFNLNWSPSSTLLSK